jgi:hypothetical protein
MEKLGAWSRVNPKMGFSAASNSPILNITYKSESQGNYFQSSIWGNNNGWMPRGNFISH